MILAALALAASIGPVYSTYDSDRIKSEWGLQGTVGTENVYVWGSYERPDMSLVGQDMNALKMWGAGVGVKTDGPLYGFAEFGYYNPSTNPDSAIEHEAVSTALCQDHCGSLGHPGKWKHAVYRLSSGYGGSIGAGKDLGRWAGVRAGYRFLRLGEAIDACTGDDSTCHYPVTGSHWQNRGTLSLGAWFIGVHARF